MVSLVIETASTTVGIPIAMTGTPVTMENGKLNIPNDPVIHYIEGDGIGVDITPVMIKVVDASVECQ